MNDTWLSSCWNYDQVWSLHFYEWLPKSQIRFLKFLWAKVEDEVWNFVFETCFILYLVVGILLMDVAATPMVEHAPLVPLCLKYEVRVPLAPDFCDIFYLMHFWLGFIFICLSPLFYHHGCMARWWIFLPMWWRAWVQTPLETSLNFNYLFYFYFLYNFEYLFNLSI